MYDTRATYPYEAGLSPSVWYSSDGTSVNYSVSIDSSAGASWFAFQYMNQNMNYYAVITQGTSNSFTFNWLNHTNWTTIKFRCVCYDSQGGTILAISNISNFTYNGLPPSPSPSPTPVPDPGPTVDPVNPVSSPTPIPVPTPYPSYNPVPGDPTYGYWDFIRNFFSNIFNFITPWGIAFGAVVVGVFGLPLLVKAIKKFF